MKTSIAAVVAGGFAAVAIQIAHGQAPASRPAQAPDPNRPPTLAEPSTAPGKVLDISGNWNGSPRVRPANSERVPWGKDNFPVLNERGLAYQKLFDEAMASKYDCIPSSSPAIQYDPYAMNVVQWPDRVLFRYEKDDQTRTVWLDGRKPTVQDYSIQGFSVGRYEGNALIVETDHFVFDVTGFDDYNGIPSSQMKKVTERYWREGTELRLTLTVEDSIFLRRPASYTARDVPRPSNYELVSWEGDPQASRAPVKMRVPKYK